MTEHPSPPPLALSAFVSAIGATSTSSGVNPAPLTAAVISSTWSVLAATIITFFSPFSLSPRTCLSQIISSIGNGMFCSISKRTIWSNLSAPPAAAIDAKRGNTICPEIETDTGPGFIPFSRTISRIAGESIASAFPESSGAASAAMP